MRMRSSEWLSAPSHREGEHEGETVIGQSSMGSSGQNGEERCRLEVEVAVEGLCRRSGAEPTMEEVEVREELQVELEHRLAGIEG